MFHGGRVLNLKLLVCLTNYHRQHDSSCCLFITNINNLKMKYLYILITFTLSINSSFAQISATVLYKSILIKNGNAPIYEMLTIQGNKSSYQFISKKNPEKVTVNEKTGVTTIHRQNSKQTQPFVYVDLIKKEMITKTSITEDDGDRFMSYKVIEPFPIKWNLSSETMKIKNFLCKKATTTFRGRNYVAWYTESIPIQAGPFKFVGLPGLILKIEDDKNEVAFYAEEIKIPNKQSLNLPDDIFKNNIPITEFIKKWKIADKKSELALRSKLISKLPVGSTVELTDDDNNEIEKFNK